MITFVFNTLRLLLWETPKLILSFVWMVLLWICLLISKLFNFQMKSGKLKKYTEGGYNNGWSNK